MASGDGLVVDDTTDPNYSNTVIPFILGDMNGDGVLDGDDINAFVLALTNPDDYLAIYPNLTDYVQRGDVNQKTHRGTDGQPSSADRNPQFVCAHRNRAGQRQFQEAAASTRGPGC